MLHQLGLVLALALEQVPVPELLQELVPELAQGPVLVLALGPAQLGFPWLDQPEPGFRLGLDQALVPAGCRSQRRRGQSPHRKSTKGTSS